MLTNPAIRYTRHYMDISQTIHLLGDLLGKVISDLESPEIFNTEERIRTQAKARRAGEEVPHSAPTSSVFARWPPSRGFITKVASPLLQEIGVVSHLVVAYR